ncbi:hypothetical protein [Paenibacillus antarcticus]|uniref:hypothetical protein n=1 Tax=Paenibacillus antarcticus TaxID=253703 RepID=UPI0012EE1CFB|nr:hypothetical protein [Paenibacillus antarcticus]
MKRRRKKLILELVTAIVEDDCIDDRTTDRNRERIAELRNVGENLLANRMDERIDKIDISVLEIK